MKKNKNFILLLIVIFITTYALLWAGFTIYQQIRPASILTAKQNIKTVGQTIQASGNIRSTQEANLTFQTGGRLVYLPFKEGNQIYKGETIASLDTYDLQRQLQVALNNYQIQRDTFDQTQANSQTGVLQGSQNYALQNLNTLKPTGDTNNNIINDIAKRILDQNQASLNNSVINVEIANYALQLSNLTSPIDGILVHADVKTPYVNITPLTTWTVVNPKAYVFRTNVDASEIDFVKIGNSATISLNGVSKKFTGSVENIYPQIITTSDGEQVYQVDIYSQSLLAYNPKYEQTGSAIIDTNSTSKTDLVPSFLVVHDNYLWINKNNQNILEKLKIGQTHENLTEILGGLPKGARLIENPKDLIEKNYLIE